MFNILPQLLALWRRSIGKIKFWLTVRVKSARLTRVTKPVGKQ
jgi:hypothetical protein